MTAAIQPPTSVTQPTFYRRVIYRRVIYCRDHSRYLNRTDPHPNVPDGTLVTPWTSIKDHVLRYTAYETFYTPFCPISHSAHPEQHCTARNKYVRRQPLPTNPKPAKRVDSPVSVTSVAGSGLDVNTDVHGRRRDTGLDMCGLPTTSATMKSHNLPTGICPTSPQHPSVSECSNKTERTHAIFMYPMGSWAEVEAALLKEGGVWGDPGYGGIRGTGGGDTI